MAWLTQHQAALAAAFRRLWATPLNTLLSLFAIGIALTLPGFGFVLLDNLRDVGQSVAGVQQISVFMDVAASRKDVAEIESRLKQVSTARVTFVAREDALKRLQKSEGMAEIVASLPKNPLPDAFIIEPANTEPAALEIMKKELATWPKVAHVQLDSAWVKRFDAFLRLGKLALWMLAGLFAAGLVAVTFNTIRLQVVAHAAEIEVARLIGATDAFIRRPFYYYGALQGAFGGLLAAGLVLLALKLLAGPVSELAELYGASFSLGLPGPMHVLALSGAGGFLGWLGAQLSVSLSLTQFD
ncbi:permease-like cell division protein FtsX [Dechloromonas sp. ZS-1]|uniref:permease-like cell division protein FtsX n=1 Tax=Dechloromonas sp. ZS-1 TaxID=3138067 RepID=UPI0031FD2645